MFDHGWVPFRRQNLIQNGSQGSPNRALRLPTAPLRRPRRTGMTLESPRLDFGSSRAPFWFHFGSHFELVFGVFWELKSMTFFHCFLMGFGAHLEAIWGPKWLPNEPQTRSKNNRKTSSILAPKKQQKLTQNGAHNEPKSHKKTNEKRLQI